MFSAKIYWRMHAFYITGQVCHEPVRELQVVHGFIISANIDDREAIQVRAQQPLTKGFLHYKLSRNSYYIRGYPYSLLKG